MDSTPVVVTNAGGAVTSSPVRLDVDPTFTKITTGAIVTDQAYGLCCAWGDYDNDGYIDLVVSTGVLPPEVAGPCLLYRNNTNGTFTKITSGPLVTDVGNANGLAWGDYDNDGALELVITEWDYNNQPYKNRVYHNDGNGSFTNVANVAPAQDGGNANVAAWGDYDNDGFLDLAVGSYGGDYPPHNNPNALYHNRGDGTFTKMTTNQVGPMAANLNVESVNSCIWGDYDDDGYLDMLFLVDSGPGQGSHSVLVHNNGNGTFNQVTNTPFDTLSADCSSGVWADFFNTNRLDLFIVNGEFDFNQVPWFFRNDGQGVLTRLSASQVGPLATNASQGFACAAADYDNDGYLDLFFSNVGGQGNLLYHNNRDGTFRLVTTGSLVHDRAYSLGCAWGDYDNDGFMDLYVANGGGTAPQAGFLYRNNGNTNHWLKLKLVGTTSNRSAIGAKVRLQATIWGQTFWQRRDVSGGGSFAGQDDLRPNFGLGDATNAQTVRIEWPSGIVQELHQVAANQILTVTEPVRLEVTGAGQFQWRSWKGQSFVVEGSTDLVDWAPLGSVTAQISSSTNFIGRARFSDPDAPAATERFYRVRAQ